MNYISKMTLVILAVIFASACKKENADPKPRSDDANQGVDSSDTGSDGADDGGVGQDGASDGGTGDEGNGDDGGHGEVPTSYTVNDLLQTAKKATTRFERLAITNSAFKRVKTWKSEYYAWAKLTYTVTTDENTTKEEHIFLACHFHGDELGCHKKDQSDPSEPSDSEDDDGLPPIDDELPPIDDEIPMAD
jgi:hypothetical protein